MMIGIGIPTNHNNKLRIVPSLRINPLRLDNATRYLRFRRSATGPAARKQSETSTTQSP